MNCHRLESYLSHNPFAARHLPGLDGLRAIAVTFVVISHFFAAEWLPDGQFGVLMFFVLSGFLITLLLLKELAQTGTISIRDFYIRRARRILPAFYVSSILATGLGIITGLGFHWQELLAASSFASNYFYIVTGQESNKILGVTWSLSVEEQFYVIWPALVYLCRRKLRIIAKALLGAIGVIWVYRAVMWYGLGTSQWYIMFSFETRADALLIGAWGALSIHQGSKWWRHFTNIPAMSVVSLILIAWSIISSQVGTQWRAGPGFTIGALLSGILVLQSVVVAPSWLVYGPVVKLGQLSYSIYLFHTSALAIAHWTMPNVKYRIVLPVAAAITLLVSAASYYGIEQPLRRRIGHQKDKQRSRD